MATIDIVISNKISDGILYIPIIDVMQYYNKNPVYGEW